MYTCTLYVLNKKWRMCPTNILHFKMLDGCWILNVKKFQIKLPEKKPSISMLGLGKYAWYVNDDRNSRCEQFTSRLSYIDVTIYVVHVRSLLQIDSCWLSFLLNCSLYYYRYRVLVSKYDLKYRGECKCFVTTKKWVNPLIEHSCNSTYCLL